VFLKFLLFQRFSSHQSTNRPFESNERNIPMADHEICERQGLWLYFEFTRKNSKFVCDFRFCFSRGAVCVFVILLSAAEPAIEEWNQIIATVQQHNLTWLDLSRNQIVVIPDSIAQLHTLKVLWLYGMICVIAVCMQLFAHITENQIEKLPDSIGDLANLQFLSINSMFDGIAHSAASSHHRQQDQNDP
jgi:hypothetical protein